MADGVRKLKPIHFSEGTLEGADLELPVPDQASGWGYQVDFGGRPVLVIERGQITSSRETEFINRSEENGSTFNEVLRVHYPENGTIARLEYEGKNRLPDDTRDARLEIELSFYGEGIPYEKRISSKITKSEISSSKKRSERAAELRAKLFEQLWFWLTLIALGLVGVGLIAFLRR